MGTIIVTMPVPGGSISIEGEPCDVAEYMSALGDGTPMHGQLGLVTPITKPPEEES